MFDIVIEYQKKMRLTEIRTLYFALVFYMCSEKRMSRIKDEWIAWLRRKLQEFKANSIVIFK